LISDYVNYASVLSELHSKGVTSQHNFEWMRWIGTISLIWKAYVECVTVHLNRDMKIRETGRSAYTHTLLACVGQLYARGCILDLLAIHTDRPEPVKRNWWRRLAKP
jgi:hypothetical protein